MVPGGFCNRIKEVFRRKSREIPDPVGSSVEGRHESAPPGTKPGGASHCPAAKKRAGRILFYMGKHRTIRGKQPDCIPSRGLGRKSRQRGLRAGIPRRFRSFSDRSGARFEAALFPLRLSHAAPSPRAPPPLRHRGFDRQVPAAADGSYRTRAPYPARAARKTR